ncbi:prepilin-type N-terminal cleavage/methylation domain-containing protein [Wenzhouxiangella sp. 15181]|nr:prepilin-type N-terminal cleavage/methylation domain-containing protein [Wenzhouxiangella sp. 15181]RFP67777.1 prepilin-type N-terminal cleavage/methylation domain-containing protein [Wenzhouxiangella sp. 15190]
MTLSRLQAPTNGMPARSAGFTMIELIVVLIILGALAFVAIPRLDLPSLKVMPAAEQIASEIRYAQNLALTRAEPYTFELAGNTISISGPDATLSTGDASKTFDGVSISGSNITFTSRFGAPVPPVANPTVTVAAASGNAVDIVVEGETGYVYIVE